MVKKFTAWVSCAFIGSLLLSQHSLAQATPKLSDPEIASVAVVANQIDIGYAEIAEKKSKDPDVLKFAQTMSSDHNAIIGQAVAIHAVMKGKIIIK